MGASWTHKDLDVWQKAMDLAEMTYRITEHFPASERYALAAQMRRASVSVLSNIAEGAARRTRPDFLHFLHISRGSLAELETHSALIVRLGFVDNVAELDACISQVGQLLTGLINKLRGSSS